MQGFPEGVNAIGVAGLVVFILCWLGALISFFRIDLRRMNAEGRDFMGVWKDSEASKRFLTFFGFCFTGFAAGLVAILFGGWPINGG